MQVQNMNECLYRIYIYIWIDGQVYSARRSSSKEILTYVFPKMHVCVSAHIQKLTVLKTRQIQIHTYIYIYVYIYMHAYMNLCIHTRVPRTP